LVSGKRLSSIANASYTQQELANMLGVSQVMISRWENGEENFTIATLARISKALGMALYNPLEKCVV